MTRKYIFTESEIKDALRDKYLDPNKIYSIDIKEVEAENYYGYTYRKIIAEATEFDLKEKENGS